jgi:hypothetical protein
VTTHAGLRGGHSLTASPPWCDSCQRSGRYSSTRSAGWVLTRPSTLRRVAGQIELRPCLYHLDCDQLAGEQFRDSRRPGDPVDQLELIILTPDHERRR